MQQKRTRKPLTAEQMARKIEYNNQLVKETIDVFHIKAQKRRNLPERIAKAVESGLSNSKQSYIIEAIEQRLEKDGF